MSNTQLIKQIQSGFIKNEYPDFKTGMEVEISQSISEGNKSRTQKYKWIIIKISGKTPLEKTITVRRKIGPFGVEKIFAIHSPTIEQIEILRQFKVRRSNIWYIRDLTWKAARLKEVRK